MLFWSKTHEFERILHSIATNIRSIRPWFVGRGGRSLNVGAAGNSHQHSVIDVADVLSHVERPGSPDDDAGLHPS